MGKDVSKKDGPDAAADRHHVEVAALQEVGGELEEGKEE
jgi:hypothetical protein